ncbi:MAG: hypothetical protein CVV44_03790 [Spirochaetae bacterium HGW-Spirochaetae-1]|jgi:hypothetical protein|nr:MAG: hypothetical protein CVV44_03790 [Spirochaetae bacterium HGW-Spirochaetae-1]
MKKIAGIVIVAILLTSIQATGGIYGKIEGSFVVGESEYYLYKYKENTINFDDCMYTDIQLGYRFHFFNDNMQLAIFTGIQTWCYYNGWSPTDFKPFEDIYTIGSNIKYRGAYLEYKHICAHPVSHEKYYMDDRSWTYGISTVTIGYEFEFKD